MPGKSAPPSTSNVTIGPDALAYAPEWIPLLDQLDDETAQQVLDVLYAGIANGTNPRDLVSQLIDCINPSQALTVARTEMLGAFRDSALDTYRDNSDVVGQWMWVATLSPDTCIACLESDGETFSLDEDMDSHPNCRCTPVPVTVPWSGILGPVGIDDSDMPDATGATGTDFMTGSDWFSQQDAATQRSMLGPSAYNAWQQGDLNLSDLAAHDSSGQLYQASLSELGLDFRDYLDSQLNIDDRIDV